MTTGPTGRRRRTRSGRRIPRSEEHTSELQSLRHLVCRLLLEKKKSIDDFELGADDYVAKPFSNTDVIARTRTRLRRSPHDAVSEALLTFSVHGSKPEARRIQG